MSAGTSRVTPHGDRLVLRLWLGFAVLAVFLCASLFIPAGRLDWWQGWAYALVMLASTVASRLLLLKTSPELIGERAGFTSQQGAKGWDRVLVPLIAIYGPLATMILAGLDARFGWTDSLPVIVPIVALVVIVAAYLLGMWAMLTNRFFSSVVRIQTERGHTVVTGGPYGYVRHPAYAGSVLAWLATPLALGSLWALVPAVVVASLTVVRTALEDRTLCQELQGYGAYALRVRYRLFPGVW